MFLEKAHHSGMAYFCSSCACDGAEYSAATNSCTMKHKVLSVACGCKVLVVTVAESSEDISVKELSVDGDSSSVLCVAVSPSSSHLCVCTDNKNLALWKAAEKGVAGWSHVGVRTLPKRPTALCFTMDEKWVIVGDKTGEVYRFPLDGIADVPGEHVLGHFSMLLDMVLSPSNSHVITCDRDEKIRVSEYPNSYNIKTYCLGHTEFVSSICLCPKWPSILISGSGVRQSLDGTVKSWDYAKGKLLDSQEFGNDVAEGGVVKVCCSSHDSPVVVVAFENSPQLHSLILSGKGSLMCGAILNLLSVPWDIVFDWSNQLWVCLHQQSEPVLCFQWEGESTLPAKVHPHQLPVLNALCKWDHYNDLLATSTRRDWKELKKQHVFDNMESYLSRKKERLESSKKSEAHKTTPPPCKKIRPDTN